MQSTQALPTLHLCWYITRGDGHANLEIRNPDGTVKRVLGLTVDRADGRRVGRPGLPPVKVDSDKSVRSYAKPELCHEISLGPLASKAESDLMMAQANAEKDALNGRVLFSPEPLSERTRSFVNLDGVHVRNCVGHVAGLLEAAGNCTMDHDLSTGTIGELVEATGRASGHISSRL